MAEMIIPGTSIEVWAEGLISAGRSATRVVGVVGTASAREVKPWTSSTSRRPRPPQPASSRTIRTSSKIAPATSSRWVSPSFVHP